MNDAALKAALEREERAYENLVQVLASLGTMLAESIRKDRDLSEFLQHKRDLLLLTRSADIRRTELKAELLGRQLKKAEEEQSQVIEAAKGTAADLEEASSSYARAANVERRWGLETRRLEEVRRDETGGPRAAPVGRAARGLGNGRGGVRYGRAPVGYLGSSGGR